MFTFFLTINEWLSAARDVSRAALPEEKRAPNLSGLVREVFGLPLDKTCQVSWVRKELCDIMSLEPKGNWHFLCVAGELN